MLFSSLLASCKSGSKTKNIFEIYELNLAAFTHTNNLTTYLIVQLFSHDSLRVQAVNVRQVHQCFPHVLVKVDAVRVLHELPHNFSLLVFNDENFFGPGHPADHHHSHLFDD